MEARMTKKGLRYYPHVDFRGEKSRGGGGFEIPEEARQWRAEEYMRLKVVHGMYRTIPVAGLANIYFGDHVRLQLWDDSTASNMLHHTSVIAERFKKKHIRLDKLTMADVEDFREHVIGRFSLSTAHHICATFRRETRSSRVWSNPSPP